MVAERPLPAFVKGLDRPWRIVVGLALVVLGLWLVARPLTSLTLLALYVGITLVIVGVGDLIESRGRRGEGRDGVRTAFGLLWLVIGVGAVLMPGRASETLPAVLAVLMAFSGVLRVVRAQGGDVRSRDRRWSASLLGAAEALLGLVALMWPDVTLVVVAVLFGVRAVVLGVQLLWDALARRAPGTPGADDVRPPRRVWRIGRLVASGGALVLALVVLTASVLVRTEETASVREPDGDPELSTPGHLLDAEPFTSEVPDDANGWRIWYSTVDQHGEPTWATALVVVPDETTDGGHDVVAWAHGTTGQARQCAPSLLDEPFTAGAFPAVMDDVVDRGWAVVAPDYVGLGGPGEHAYLVGEVGATAMLDAVRAARQLREAELSARTAVWGHSQGGGVALWTAQVQPEYAPDVPLVGTVAMAPATDLPAVAARLHQVTGGSVFASYVVAGYAATYDDVTVRNTVRPAAVKLVEEMASRCLSEPGVLASVLTALSLGDADVIRPEALSGEVGKHLSENVPTSLGDAPVLLAQGSEDQLISPAQQGAWVKRMLRAGHVPDYEVVPGMDHLSLVQEGSPFLAELMDWTAARLAGEPVE
ncbi:alpha/beta fold hydrolase [Nocardioides yefusunii]|uniref:Alpha/beta fold hydrolase n=1 Tax=Nocardioides yefusunii TaxID=2500546 RepID=A0ABW1QY74_9ACTN|nr:alpha/beta fold hydrolase [Nocardioides yefusunii]